MKFRIIRDAPQSKLVDILPKEYQKFITHIEDETAPCTVIMFRHDKRDVVRSREAIKALRYLGEVEERVIAVSGGFTAEAEEILREKNIEIISYGFPWTDKSHEDTRVFIASNVKRPA